MTSETGHILFADGIHAYEQLFVNQYKKAPWLFLLQDHGFGGNYDKFGRGGSLDRIIQKGVKPEFVFFISSCVCLQDEANRIGQPRLHFISLYKSYTRRNSIR